MAETLYRSTRSGKRYNPINKGKGKETESTKKKQTKNTKKKKTESTSRPFSKKKPSRDSATTSSTPTLYLRIGRRFLNLLPAPTEEQPNPQPIAPVPGTVGNLNVIVTPLPELLPFSGNTVDWLIRVARQIFEPLGTSSLYTFTTGTVESWLEREMVQEQWRIVQDGEQLRSTIYEFCPDNNFPITLTRFSLRQTRSVTTDTSTNRATAFRETLLRRHQQCIISTFGQDLPQILIASHLIPRRLGDSGVQSVIHRFTNLPTPVDRYNPIIGVPLFLSLDLFVDSYQLGFWNCGSDQYILHNFLGSPLNRFGVRPTSSQDPLVHGHQITLTSHDPSFPLPPVGVFNWHYVQCVLTRFSTLEYQQFDNIHYSCLPFRTREDIDDDESDCDFDDERNIANPPYPSYMIELSQARAHQRLEEEERNRTVLTWSSGAFTR